MDIESLKKALEKAKGNSLVSFLFFLLVSCSLWFTLTLNRVYETDISVSVHVRNIPKGVSLENDGNINLRVLVSGDGTDLFGYIFNDGIVVSADYSEFSRRGGRLSMSSSALWSRVSEQLGSALSLKNFLADSLVATVRRATATVPVKKNRLELKAAKGCELLSVKYNPEEVRVTAFVDEIAEVTEVRTPALVCDGLQQDTVFELTFLPGKYIDVKPEKVQVSVSVSRYVNSVIRVPVEYVKFPSGINLGYMPQDVDVAYEVLEINAEKIKPFDFSVQLLFEDYARSVVLGKVGDLEKKFTVMSTPPFVRNARVVGVEQVVDSITVDKNIGL